MMLDQLLSWAGGGEEFVSSPRPTFQRRKEGRTWAGMCQKPQRWIRFSTSAKPG